MVQWHATAAPWVLRQRRERWRVSRRASKQTQALQQHRVRPLALPISTSSASASERPWRPGTGAGAAAACTAPYVGTSHDGSTSCAQAHGRQAPWGGHTNPLRLHLLPLAKSSCNRRNPNMRRWWRQRVWHAIGMHPLEGSAVRHPHCVHRWILHGAAARAAESTSSYALFQVRG